MRTISLRYSGDCQRCGATLPAGHEAVYERHVGIFCPPCEPTDPDEVRSYRQAARDRKADLYDAWADKRRVVAEAQLGHDREHYLSDWAFVTQPGDFPLRRRVRARVNRAEESLSVAAAHERKADALRQPARVAGDAARKYEAQRDAVRQWIAPGVRVHCAVHGAGAVVRVHRLSATVDWDRGGRYSYGLEWLRPASQAHHA